MSVTHTKFITTIAATSLLSPTLADHKQESLIVIDWISLTGSTTAAGDMVLTIYDAQSNVIYYAASTMEATSSDTLFINFGPGGFPCWTVVVSGADFNSTPVPSTPQIQAGVGDATAIYCIVGYHYERPSLRRR